MRSSFVILFLLFLSFNASARVTASPEIQQCFFSAGIKFAIDWRLLYAIAEVESSLNPRAMGYNRKNGKVLSVDLGMMQINSSWLPVLEKMGITRNVLLDNPCQNIHVGAWILAKNISQNGINWTSVGAYNAGFKNANEENRMKYAKKVYARFIELTGG